MTCFCRRDEVHELGRTLLDVSGAIPPFFESLQVQPYTFDELMADGYAPKDLAVEGPGLGWKGR